jgi:hypothetical protein
MSKSQLFLLCAALLPLSLLAGTPPDDKNCTKAIAMAEETLAKMVVSSAKEEKDLRVLKERQEKLIKEGREKRLSECEIWSKVMGLAFNQ